MIIDTTIEPRQLTTRTSRWVKLKEYWQQHWMTVTILTLLGLFVVAYLANRIFVSVYPGQAMVLFDRFSNDPVRITPYSEGFYVIAPWNVAYKYDLRFQQISVPIVALSKNGLEVTVDASITFHPVFNLVPQLHRRYGPDYARKLVLPELRTAIQDIVGQYVPEEIYSLARSAQHEEIFAQAKRVIGGVYIDIEDVSIINVQLPAKVQDAIQAKLEEQQQAELYEYRLEKEKKEAERKRIEAQGIRDFQATISNLTPQVLQWKGIEATLELAKSPNSKVVVIGDKSGLPLVLGETK